MRTESGIWYEVVGSGDPVLMLMGFGMRGLVWRPQVEDLKLHHAVATYDNRGLGQTPFPEKPFTLVDMANDALEVADSLGWERFHAVGVSMGGMVAQELAIRHPGRLKSLSLLATQPGGPRAVVPPVRSFPRLLLIGVAPERFRGRLTHRILYPNGSLAHLTSEQRLQRADDADGVLGLAAIRRLQLAAIRKHDTRDRLQHIIAATLVIQPALDRLCRPEHSYTLVERIPRARLLRLPQAGHGLVFHAAPEVNRALLDHFARHA